MNHKLLKTSYNDHQYTKFETNFCVISHQDEDITQRESLLEVQCL